MEGSLLYIFCIHRDIVQQFYSLHHLSLIHISEPTRHYTDDLVCRLLLEKKKKKKNIQNTKKNKNIHKKRNKK